VIRRCGQEFDVCSTFRLLCNVLLDFWKSPSTTIYGIVQTLCKDFVKGWRRQLHTIVTPPVRLHHTVMPSIYHSPILGTTLPPWPSAPRPQVTFTSIMPSSRVSAHPLRDVIRTGRRSPTFCNRGRRDLAKQTNFTVYSAAPMRIKKVLPQISWLLLFFNTQR
jgi:hypothetical protein